MLVVLINIQISILPTTCLKKLSSEFRNPPVAVTRPTFMVKTRNPPEPEKSYPSQHYATVTKIAKVYGTMADVG